MQKEVAPSSNQVGLYSPNPCARTRLRPKEIRRLEDVKAKIEALEGKQYINKIEMSGVIDIDDVTCLKYQAFRPRLIVGTRSGNIHVWSTDTQKTMNMFPVAATTSRSGIEKISGSASSSHSRNAIKRAWIVNELQVIRDSHAGPNLIVVLPLIHLHCYEAFIVGVLAQVQCWHSFQRCAICIALHLATEFLCTPHLDDPVSRLFLSSLLVP